VGVRRTISNCGFRNSRLESYFALYAGSYWLLTTVFCEFAVCLAPCALSPRKVLWKTSSRQSYPSS